MKVGKRDGQHRLAKDQLRRRHQDILRRVGAALDLDGLETKPSIGAGRYEPTGQGLPFDIGEDAGGNQPGGASPGKDQPEAGSAGRFQNAGLALPVGCALGTLGRADERDQSSHCAVSSRWLTSSSPDRPTKRACSGTSDVAVMPGTVLISSM